MQYTISFKNNRPPMNFRPFLSISFLSLLLLPACKTTPANQPYFEQNRQAEVMMNQNRYDQAARLYQELSQNTPRHTDYRLLAADALIKSGQLNKARQLLNPPPSTQLNAPQKALFDLLNAQIELSQGNDKTALQSLEKIPVTTLPLEKQRDYFRALAFARALSGNALASVQARIQLGDLLLDPQAIQKNNQAIIETLNRLPQQTLVQADGPQTLKGWIDFVLLLKQHASNPELLRSELEQWSWQYPDHPANNTPLENLLTERRQFQTHPSTIAVFLPESGRYAKASAAIKSGLQAAAELQQTGQTAKLIFLDSNAENPVTLYQRAVNTGAELIIGPLQKSNIAQLASLTDLPIPVIALNQVDGVFHDNLIQFGLSPSDDTREITRFSWQNNHRKALFLAPETRKGERILNYLNEFWQQQGGLALESQQYRPAQYDFSAPINRLMNQDESEQRYYQLRRTLNRTIQFSPRARTDGDTIFIMATPKTARSLNPQLKFYGARNIPVYATSSLYNGIPSPSFDSDLDGIHFCDIPWLFPDLYNNEPSLSSLYHQFKRLPRHYRRLLALGIDAYNMIPHLNELSSLGYPGATGSLSLTSDNRILRDLVCARFEQGVPTDAHYLDSRFSDMETDDTTDF
jgi:outer membrane PBP1 activator LpoA protein